MFLGEIKRKSTRSLEISYSTLFTNLFSDGREINDGRFLRISFSASMNAIKAYICLNITTQSLIVIEVFHNGVIYVNCFCIFYLETIEN